ncbi:hypothetical protein DL96DRAFT_649403 [Flagelloscypha sp. PMI_526]|nr:hypothetical protein DL96DRAFT_649403 [Flagelloscypha sp. PMI_526]
MSRSPLLLSLRLTLWQMISWDSSALPFPALQTSIELSSDNDGLSEDSSVPHQFTIIHPPSPSQLTGGSIECQNFCAILEANPSLSQYVQALSLIRGAPWPHKTEECWMEVEYTHLITLLPMLANLKSFTISRYIPTEISTQNGAWDDFPLELREKLLPVIRLPSLTTLDLTYGFYFNNIFSDLHLGDHSNITSLALSCPTFPKSQSAADPVTSPAVLKRLELNYIGSDPEGPDLIKAFDDPKCSFDITKLEHLVINGINEQDFWIDTLLKAQKEPQLLTTVWLHGIFALRDTLPFAKRLSSDFPRITSLSVSAEMQTYPSGSYFQSWLSQFPALLLQIEYLRFITYPNQQNITEEWDVWTHMDKLDPEVLGLEKMPKLKSVEVVFGVWFTSSGFPVEISRDEDHMHIEEVEKRLEGVKRRGLLSFGRMDRWGHQVAL